MCTADTLHMITLHDTSMVFHTRVRTRTGTVYAHLMGLIPVTCTRDQVPLRELAIFVKTTTKTKQKQNKQLV